MQKCPRQVTGRLLSILFVGGLLTSTWGAPSAETNNATTFCTLLKHVKSEECSVRGDVIMGSNYNMADPSIVSTVEECAFLCARRVTNAKFFQGSGQGYCSSFGFEPRTGFCQLGYNAVNGSIAPSPKSPVEYYDIGCFDCGRFCRQPYGVNILDNGGFEGQDFGPWTTAYGTLGMGHHSPQAFGCYLYEGQRGCRLSQQMNLCPFSWYSVQFDYLTKYFPDVDYEPTIQINAGGYFTRTVASKNVKPHNWKTLRGYFHYLEQDHSGTIFNFPEGGDATIDNVKVARIPTPMANTSASNLIDNGGFESGKFDPWKNVYNYNAYNVYIGPFNISSPGINSNYAANLTIAPVAYYQQAVSTELTQTVTTIPNSTYIVSFDISIQQSLSVYLFVGSPHDNAQYNYYYQPGNHTFIEQVLAPTNITKVGIQLANSNYSSYTMALVDNVRMVPTI